LIVRKLLVLAVLVAFPISARAAVIVELTKKKDAIDVSIGDEPFATYKFAKDQPKPYFAPVRGPGGLTMTRPIFDENGKEHREHKHHRGIWVAVDEVNKIKFWAEQGKIVNVNTELAVPSGNPAVLEVTNEWRNDAGQAVVTEHSKISIYANRLMVYDITFTAGKAPATFEDTKEGLFGFRMVHSMRESEGGHVVNAEGLKGTSQCWGKPSKWIDYYGPVEGKTLGVTLMDDPKNFRPSRYHVRNYGLFSISPFGEKAYTKGAEEAKPVTIDAGESLKLRYGLYIHAGDTKAGKVKEAYRQFLSSRAE
jgi:hypothetical protein